MGLRPNLLPSAFVRAAVWYLIAAWGIYLVRNPTPSIAGAVAAAPVLLVVTAPAGFAYIFLVRTWTGTVAAGAVMTVLATGLLLVISKESETSSTAGIGVIYLPILLAVPVGLTVWAERRRWRGTARP